MNKESVIEKTEEVLQYITQDASSLAQIVHVIGYNSIDYFLEDNPGAIESIYEFISDHLEGYIDEQGVITPEEAVDRVEDLADQIGLND